MAVTLTREELLSLSKQLANATQELRNSDNRKKETVKMLDSEIAKWKAQQDLLASKIANGYEYRNVECTWMYDLNTEIKTLSRDDTGEVVRTEKITMKERQKSLPLKVERQT